MEILRKTRGINIYYEISLKKRYYRGEVRGEYGGGACYIVEMLQNNRLHSLLPVRLQWMDMACSLLFKADGCLSLGALYGKREPGWEEVEGLMRDLSGCIREMQDHLLPAEGIVLSTSYIFWDENIRHYRFLYTPEPECSFSGGMKKLLEEIMPLFAHENKEDVVRFYDLYGKFLDERFTPGMLLSFTDRLDIQAGNRKMIQTMSEPEQDFQLPVLWSPGMDNESSVPQSRAINCGENGAEKKKSEPDKAKNIIPWLLAGGLLPGLLFTALYIKNSVMTKIVGLIGLFFAFALLFFRHMKKEEGGEVKKAFSGGGEALRQTGMGRQEENGMRSREAAAYTGYGDGAVTGISQNAEVTGDGDKGFSGITRLIPADTALMPPINVTEGKVRIGRSEEENEYCIPAPGISRVHANLLCKDGNVYLEDLDSTNGTYVNQVRISKEQGTKLHYGDVVSFAGEEYYCV